MLLNAEGNFSSFFSQSSGFTSTKTAAIGFYILLHIHLSDWAATVALKAQLTTASENT